MTVINTNLKALSAHESIRASDLKLATSMERLSTGLRINAAKDDAAGLSIANRMTAQIRGFAKAIQNSSDAISMSQTAEGGYQNVGDILQRMRELAVQAATGTVNASDRASIQLEVQQLKFQIEDIAIKTHHNNIKLLDGTAQDVVIQTGANAGDTIKLDFGSARTKDIGLGSRAALNSINGKFVANTAFDALSAAALFINGVAVGATLAIDDAASYSGKSASAIAKVAAINKVAELSGVYAKVSHNTVSGTTMTVAASVQSAITINGVTTDTFSTSGSDNALTRKAVVSAINVRTTQTGVRAVDTGSDETGVTLVADDGRNITLNIGADFSSAALGLRGVNSADVTHVGSYELYTLDHREINISFADGQQDVEAMSGLRAGSYDSDRAGIVSFKRVPLKGSSSMTSASQGLMNGNSLIINGVAIGQGLTIDDTASTSEPVASSRRHSAIAIAAAINRSTDLTSVSAFPSPNILRGSGFIPGDTVYTVYLNGVTFGVNNQTRDGAIDSFNRVAGQTGVSASAWGAGIQLVAADGRNIVIGSSATAASIGLTGLSVGAEATSAEAIVHYSTVTLASDNVFEIRAGSNGIPNLEALGFRQGRFGGKDNGLKINQIDVSLPAGASQAITAIDAAIDTINLYQAKSGAFNNRLDYIINNLAESSQNLTASRSRITDTDYAKESTNLAKNQIIQQAATAMLAQANQSAQTVLSLLK